MDQLKTTLAHILKFRFWYLSGICCLTLLGNWYWFNGSLGAARTTRTSVIDGKIREIDGVLAVTVPVDSVEDENKTVKTHPNSETQKGMEEEIRKAATSLLKAWELRRTGQEKIQVWPAELIGSEEFVRSFSKYDPPEKFPDIVQDPRTDAYCLLYSKEIRKRMPAICEIIRARWQFDVEAVSEPAGNLAPGGDEGSPPEGEGEGQEGQRPGDGSVAAAPAPPSTDEVITTKPTTVIWESENQQLWQSKVTWFGGARGEVATGYQVLALQQDLWLLEAMFKVIAEINGEVVANDLAPIEKLYYVVYGQQARAQIGKVMPPDPKLIGGGAVGNMPGMPGMDNRQAGEDGTQQGGQSAAPKFNEGIPANFRLLAPFHGRYVDSNFLPMTIEEVHVALTSPTVPTEDLEVIVAKRVPFRIALRMSEGSIADFLAACSNSPFEFEVNQVRVNRYDPSLKIGEEQIGAAAYKNEDNSLKSVDSDNDSIEARINDDVDVEFFGIVRIYNPVDPARIDLVAGVTAENDGT